MVGAACYTLVPFVTVIGLQLTALLLKTIFDTVLNAVQKWTEKGKQKMSKRFIDADELMRELQEEIDFETPMYTEEQNKYFNLGLRCAIRDVKAQPTADVVEGVRCKDCKHYINWGDCITCQHWTLFEDVSTDPNAFCSYGERRAEE